MSDTCKYFLHELGKSSSLKNAITPRNKYALQFSFKHYLCQELFLMLFHEAGKNTFKIALVTENVTLSNPGL